MNHFRRCLRRYSRGFKIRTTYTRLEVYHKVLMSQFSLKIRQGHPSMFCPPQAAKYRLFGNAQGTYLNHHKEHRSLAVSF